MVVVLFQIDGFLRAVDAHCIVGQEIIAQHAGAAGGMFDDTEVHDPENRFKRQLIDLNDLADGSAGQFKPGNAHVYISHRRAGIKQEACFHRIDAHAFNNRHPVFNGIAETEFAGIAFKRYIAEL